MMDEDQDAIRMELEALHEKHGHLTPEIVLTFAKTHSKSALYTQFPWDLQTAAHAHWIDRARAILRSIKIIVHTQSQGPVSVPLFVHDPMTPHGQQGYTSILKIKGNAQPSKYLLLQEFNAAEAHLLRAEAIAAVVGNEEEVAKALEITAKMKKRIEAQVHALEEGA